MNSDNGVITASKRPHDSGFEGEHPPAKKFAPDGHDGAPSASSDCVVVPQRLVRSVIGHNGELLGKYEMESGAKIMCEQPFPAAGGDGDRTLRLSGTHMQVTQAKQLITKCIGESGGCETGSAGGFPAAVPGVGLVRPNIVPGLMSNVGLAGRAPLMSTPIRPPCGPPGGPPNVRPGLHGQFGEPSPYHHPPGQPYGHPPGPGMQGPGMHGAPMMLGPGPALMHNSPPQQQLPYGHDRFEMMVTKSSAGLVIGKGGETIKRLQADSGCRIQLIQDGPFENAVEKPLRIEGPQESVQFARSKIMEIIANDAQNPSAVDPANRLEMLVPRESVGSIIGRGGETIKRIQGETSVNIQFKPDPEGQPQPTTRTAVLTGPAESLPTAKTMIEGIIGFQSNFDGSSPVVSVHVPVPSRHTGLIIGRGGESIRQMHTESGAHIELVRDMVLPNGEKVFLVRGTKEQCDIAQNLIKTKFEQSSALPGTAGNAHGQSGGFQATESFQATTTTDSAASSILANINTDSFVKYIQTGKYEPPAAQSSASVQHSEEQQLAQLQAAGKMWAMQNAAGNGAQAAAAPAAVLAAGGDANAQAWAQYYQYMGQYNSGQYAAYPAQAGVMQQQQQQQITYQQQPYMQQYGQPPAAAQPVPASVAAPTNGSMAPGQAASAPGQYVMSSQQPQPQQQPPAPGAAQPTGQSSFSSGATSYDQSQQQPQLQQAPVVAARQPLLAQPPHPNAQPHGDAPSW